MVVVFMYNLMNIQSVNAHFDQMFYTRYTDIRHQKDVLVILFDSEFPSGLTFRLFLGTTRATGVYTLKVLNQSKQ